MWMVMEDDVHSRACGPNNGSLEEGQSPDFPEQEELGLGWGGIPNPRQEGGRGSDAHLWAAVRRLARQPATECPGPRQ